MDTEREKHLLELARKVKELDGEIIKQREEKGGEDKDLRKQFHEIEDEIKKILSESGPLDEIRDPSARETLRNVRDGNYFLLSKERKQIRNTINYMQKKYPDEFIESFFESKGIRVSEEEIDEHLNKILMDFQEEITDKIYAEEYFERKEQFSTIIVNSRLPKNIHDYFIEIRECFLFERMYAVVGLCRVLIELAFKDKFLNLGLAKKQGYKNVDDLNKYRESFFSIIREVCDKLKNDSLKKNAIELYGLSSDILHGRKLKIKLETAEVLNFVKRTFSMIEALYT